VDRYCKSRIDENGTCSIVEKSGVGNPDEAIEELHLVYIAVGPTVVKVTSEMMETRLLAAEMLFLRRMLMTKWTDKISNEDVLQLADSPSELVTTICARQIRFLDHILRKTVREAGPQYAPAPAR